jgi:DnaJ-class molecular chaperone
MDPYNILNIPKNASQTEIKKAYRKLASKYHPDKGGDEQKFKQISEAYSTIDTPQKRQEYETSQQFGGFGSAFGNFGDIFEGFFGSSARGSTQQQEQLDEEIIFDLRISLAQIKTGLSQDVVFDRNKKCKKCSGMGGENKQACQPCSATGTQTSRLGPIIQQTTCRTCYGNGFIFETKCSFCNGTSVMKVRDTIKFDLKQRS